MLLYKFRSFDNYEYLIDILLNQRLYCAHFENLNDPSEGFYKLNTRLDYRNISPNQPPPITITEVLNISSRKFNNFSNCIPNKVCALSSDFSDIRMWSYYASSHSGIALQIDIPDNNSLLTKVNYHRNFPEIEYSRNFNPESVKTVLTNKTLEWEYEKEYRIITQEDFFSIENNIQAIYFGIRTQTEKKDMLKKLFPNMQFKDTQLNPDTQKIEIL